MGLFIIDFGMLIEYFKQVRLQIATLIQHHLRACFHLLQVSLLDPHPTLHLRHLALDFLVLFCVQIV